MNSLENLLARFLIPIANAFKLVIAVTVAAAGQAEALVAESAVPVGKQLVASESF